MLTEPEQMRVYIELRAAVSSGDTHEMGFYKIAQRAVELAVEASEVRIQAALSNVAPTIPTPLSVLKCAAIWYENGLDGMLHMVVWAAVQQQTVNTDLGKALHREAMAALWMQAALPMPEEPSRGEPPIVGRPAAHARLELVRAAIARLHARDITRKADEAIARFEHGG